MSLSIARSPQFFRFGRQALTPRSAAIRDYIRRNPFRTGLDTALTGPLVYDLYKRWRGRKRKMPYRRRYKRRYGRRRYPSKRRRLTGTLRSGRRFRPIAARSRIGERPGTSNARHNTEQDIYAGATAGTYPAALAEKFLHQWQLLNIPLQSGISADNSTLAERQRNVINFRGIKFCLYLKRRAINPTIDVQRIFVNIAVISPKAGVESSSTLSTTNFFRGTDNTRSKNFDGTTLQPLEFRCLPINTDLYNIHFHKRMIIKPISNEDYEPMSLQEFYMPLKRQIRYDGNSNFPEGKNMYAVMWFVCADQKPADAAVGGLLNATIRRVRYFRETR